MYDFKLKEAINSNKYIWYIDKMNQPRFKKLKYYYFNYYIPTLYKLSGFNILNIEKGSSSIIHYEYGTKQKGKSFITDTVAGRRSLCNDLIDYVWNNPNTQNYDEKTYNKLVKLIKNFIRIIKLHPHGEYVLKHGMLPPSVYPEDIQRKEIQIYNEYQLYKQMRKGEEAEKRRKEYLEQLQKEKRRPEDEVFQQSKAFTQAELPKADIYIAGGSPQEKNTESNILPIIIVGGIILGTTYLLL